MKKILNILFLLIVLKDLFIFNDFIGMLSGLLMFFLFAHTIVNIKSRNLSTKLKFRIILYIFFSITYLYTFSIIHVVNINDIFSFYRQMTIPFSLFVIFLSIDSSNKLPKLNFILIPFILIEFLLGCIQFFDIAPPYLTKENHVIENIFCGTFMNNNFLGNIFSIIFLILFIEYKKKRYLFLSKKIFILITTLSLIGVFMSGVRTSFIVLIIGVFLIHIFMSTKKKLITILLSFSIFIIPFLPLKKLTSYSSSIERIYSGIEDAINIKDLNESNSTLTLSLRLYNLLNQETILFGQGKLFKGGYGVVDSGEATMEISLENHNQTDATLMIILIEFGIIGLIIFLIPTFLLFKFKGVEKTIISILFFLLILLTITDLGVFYTLNIFIILQYLKFNNQEKTKYENNN